MPLVDPRVLPISSPTYTFTLASLDALNIRSPHTDTDYASFTLRINPKTIDGKPATGPAQTIVKRLGDLGPGFHAINLSFPKVSIDATDTVVLNYIILNSGHVDPTKTETAMRSSADRLSSAIGAIKSLADLTAIGQLVDTIRDAASFLINSFHAVFGNDANCDGTVAVEQVVISFADLTNNTARGATWSKTTTHPGTDSAKGCGKNSVYEVTWQVKQDAASPLPAMHQ